MQVVYLDKLFLVNAVIDYIILLLAGVLLKRSINRTRLILAAVFGGLYSVFAEIVGGKIYTTIVFAIIVLVLSSFIAFGSMNFKKCLTTVATVFIISFVFGGAVSAFYTLFGSSSFFAVTGGYYINISITMFICIFAITYFLVFAVFKIFIKRQVADGYCKVKINLYSKSVTVNALIDTGHELSEPLTNRSVIVVQYKSLKPILSYRMREVLTDTSKLADCDYDIKRRIRLVPFSAIGSKSNLLIGFLPDSVELPDKRVLKRCVVAINQQELSNDGEYSAIISPEALALT